MSCHGIAPRQSKLQGADCGPAGGQVPAARHRRGQGAVLLMADAQDAFPPARRRVALRTVPMSLQNDAPEPVVARLAAAPPEEHSFFETVRKLWRHRLLISVCTVVLGGA